MPSIADRTNNLGDNNSFASPFTDRAPVSFYSSIPSLTSKKSPGCLSCAVVELDRAELDKLIFAQSGDPAARFSSRIFDPVLPKYKKTTPVIPVCPPYNPPDPKNPTNKSFFFQGNTDPNTYFRRWAFYDWDCCTFGGHSVFENGRLCDGHCVYECTGYDETATIVAVTGNIAYVAGYELGRNLPLDDVPRHSNPAYNGTIISNTIRYSTIYNAGCCNPDASQIFGALSLQVFIP